MECQSCRAALVDVAHRVEAIARDFERFVDHGLRDGQTWPRPAAVCAVGSFALLAVYCAAVLFGRAVRGLAVDGGAVGIGAGGEGRVLADVFDNAAEEGWEGGYLAGAEQGESVGLDGGRPVGLVGV